MKRRWAILLPLLAGCGATDAGVSADARVSADLAGASVDARTAADTGVSADAAGAAADARVSADAAGAEADSAFTDASAPSDVRASADLAPADAGVSADMAATAADAGVSADMASPTADLAAPPLVTGIELPLPEPVRLTAGARLSLPIPTPPAGPVVLQLRAEVWRVEDGELRLNGRPALLPGDADAAWVTVLEPWAVAADRPLTFDAAELGASLDVEATGGTLVLLAARLADPREAPPAAPAPVEPPAFEVAAPPPCAEAGCDDSPTLAAVLSAVPAGPVRFTLGPGPYTLRTPWRITRPDTHLAGAPGGTDLRWDPLGGGELSAITFAGGGPAGDPLPLAGDYSAGTSVVTLDAPVPEPAPAYVLLTADDFGEVPAICADGRDVERFQRHTVHFARVLAADADARTLTLDRPLALDLPAAAAPRVRVVRLLPGARITDLRLVAACPAALVADHVAAEACDNPEVADDDGLSLAHTVGARAERVTTRAFGKFSVRVDDALETRLTDNTMDHPSNYGDGGRGYGVHVIRSSRTRIRGERVDTARHAVVVDFGASDTQILDGDLRHAPLALVDIHGEASRDTLVRGNRLVDGLTGVLVGGGGVAVHCNDGPRHHINRNDVSDRRLMDVSVTNATRQVFVTDNRLGTAPIPLSVTLGAGDVLARDNRFEGSMASPVQVDAASGPVMLQRNTFVQTCTPEAVLPPDPARPAEAVVLLDNVYCPAGAADPAQRGEGAAQ